MNLDQLDPQPHDLLHVGQHIRRVPRMHAAARNQPLRICLHIVRDPLVDLRRKADDFRRNVIDQHRAIDADLVHVLEKRLRGSAVPLDLLKVLARFFISASASGLNSFIG